MSVKQQQALDEFQCFTKTAERPVDGTSLKVCLYLPTRLPPIILFVKPNILNNSSSLLSDQLNFDWMQSHGSAVSALHKRGCCIVSYVMILIDTHEQLLAKSLIGLDDRR